METVFQQGFLHGQSARYDDPEAAAGGDYDIVVAVSSWDKRSIEITKAKSLRGEFGILVLFDAMDDRGLRGMHDAALMKFMQSCCRKVKGVCGFSTDLDAIWGQIQAELVAAYAEKGRPLRVLLDLCACPRYYALALLAFCFGRGVANEISVFYAEGWYPEESADEAEKHEILTAGGWTAVSVPGLEGSWEPGRKLYYLVSVGFEGAKTLRLVSRLEPDRVSILFPNPGARGDYPHRTREQNNRLINLFQIPLTQTIEAHAGDAIAAWKAIQNSNIERPQDENVNYVCCGTKPHSLALGVRALVVKYAAVLYIVPDRHKVAATEASGVYWRYDISDQTSL